MRDFKVFVSSMVLLVGLLLVGCVEIIPTPSNDGNDDLRRLVEQSIAPRAVDGQTWLVTTAYRSEVRSMNTDVPVMEVESATIDAAFMSDSRAHTELTQLNVGEIWSHSITWEFRVIDADLVPDETSELYELSLDEAGVPQAVTLIEASVIGEQGPRSTAKELAPIFNLVLRRSDYRLLALDVSFQNEGERSAELIDLTSSQPTELAPELESSQVVLDFVLPEFPLDEEGRQQTTVIFLDGGGVEVAFTSVVDGSLVVQRWDNGQPWFTYSRSDDRFSWLVSN